MSTHFIHHLLKTDVLLVSKGKKDSIKCLVQNNEEGIIMRSKKKIYENLGTNLISVCSQLKIFLSTIPVCLCWNKLYKIDLLHQK